VILFTVIGQRASDLLANQHFAIFQRSLWQMMVTSPLAAI